MANVSIAIGIEEHLNPLFGTSIAFIIVHGSRDLYSVGVASITTHDNKVLNNTQLHIDEVILARSTFNVNNFVTNMIIAMSILKNLIDLARRLIIMACKIKNSSISMGAQ